MKRNIKQLICSLVTVVALVTSFSSYAGTGTIDVTNKTIDLSVFFTYVETDNNLEGTSGTTWKTCFNEASKHLWNATNGQLRIGKVKVYLRALNKKGDADIWIAKNNAGRPYATGIGVMGNKGSRIQLYDINRRTSDSASSWSFQYLVVHEMGHYTFGLWDEYIGAFVPKAKKDNWTDADLRVYTAERDGTWMTRRNVICSPQKDNDQVGIASIMDGSLMTNSTKMTEFDTFLNYNEGVLDGNDWFMTVHYIKTKESCWETLGKFTYGGKTVFPDEPLLDSPTAFPAGYKDIEFEVINTLSRMALCIDVSGSMAGDNIVLAKLGAKTFLSLLQSKRELTANGETFTVEGDQIGIVSFSSSASTQMPLTEVDKDGNTISQARTVINGLVDGGSTAIGDGTLQSLALLTGAGDKVSEEVILLLSDGQNNSGSSPADAAASVKTRGARIYSIGLGSGADSGTLASMASTTGGKYYQVSSPLGLLFVYPAISADLKGGGLLAGNSSVAAAGSATKQSIVVDSLTQEASFIVTSPDEGWDMTLTSPSGTTYSSSNSSAGVTFQNNSDEVHFNVTNPEAGNWVMNISAPAATAGSKQDTTHQFYAMATASSSTIDVNADLDSESYTYPEKALITCEVNADDPVAGAEVKAVVTAPNGVIGSIILYDDGEESHGDSIAGDGTYSNYFSSWTENGVYTFDITINAEDPTQGIAFVDPVNADQFSEPFEPSALPAFTRTITLTTEASGIPQSTDPTWLRVDSLMYSVNKKDTSTGSFKFAATMNAASGTFTPGTDDLTVTVGNNAAYTIPAAAFAQAGKQAGVYKIQDKASGISGIMKAYIGGSSRTSLVVSVKDMPNSVTNWEVGSVNVALEVGDFSQTVSLSVPQSSELKLVYNSKKNHSNTPVLYIDSLMVNTDSAQTSKDTLRLVATFASGATGYNPDTSTITFTLGEFTLTIPAGSLKGKTDKKTGVLKSASGKVSVGTAGTAVVTVKFDNANIISIKGSKLDLFGDISEMTRCSLNIGTFDEACLLTLGVKTKKTKTSYTFK